MIVKIKKLKNLGIFENYSWDASLSEFKRFNVIYGWNGSGKTTLSKLFDCLENGSHSDYPALEYEIECTSSQKFKNAEAFDKKVRVFNQDYVTRNLKIIEGKANSITLVLGEENKELVEQIKKDEITLYGDPQTPASTGLIQSAKKSQEKLTAKIKEKEKAFTDIARIIAATGGEAVRSYNSKNAKTAFAKILIPTELTEEQIKHCSLVLSQKSEPEIQGIIIPDVKYVQSNTPEKLLESLTTLLKEAEDILGQTVTSNVISRLKEHADICDWVEAGIKIHSDHGSTNCEFCSQPLPADRMTELADHFNDEDRRLKAKADDLAAKLRIVYTTLNGLVLMDRARFYEEFRPQFDIASITFDAEKKGVLGKIIEIGKRVTEKKLKTTEAVPLAETIETIGFTEVLETINRLITSHNLKISNLEREKADANQKLETHYLSTIFQSAGLLETECDSLSDKINFLTNGDPEDDASIGIVGLQARIAENQGKISNTQKACDNINEGLATFLGRKELTFEPFYVKTTVDGGEKVTEQGYIIKRGESPVKHLSEGEKTAIAFVYFTVHLQDRDFDLSKGIIIVDDPISSLDANSLFQSFAFLKNAVKDAYQVFLLTHNYDFLRLLLNWVRHIPKKFGQKGYYMVNNKYNAGVRSAFLASLDQTLQDHESEYHYLFKCLYNFKSDGTILNVYHIPNIARKVLDTFLMFRVPNSTSGYEKMTTLTFDENKKTAIYKFTNDQSHITGAGFDPSLIAETQNNVKALLEMMEAVFPEHYTILVQSISPLVVEA
jgi:wobble nucleotide-excising tRNase